jgi:general secretion pathway protein B
MSLILDALRKSEAERRNARATEDALANVPRAPTPALTGIPAWVWPGLIFAMLALAAAAWLLLARTATTEVSATPAPAMMGVAGDEAIEPAPEPYAANVEPAPHARDDRPATMAEQAPARVAPAAPPSVAASTPTPPTPQAPDRTRASAMPPAEVVATPSPALDPETRVPPSSLTAGAPTTPPRDNPRPAAPTVPARSTGGTGPLRLADLGTTDRQQLPPLKMSMHMWGPDAGKRFAIIDGNRVGEGDRIGEAVVEGIDQDGVVLAWNGLRLRVPVR